MKAPMTKELFRVTVHNVAAQARAIIDRIGSIDASITAEVRRFDPVLADLLDKGTAARRAVSVEILDHINSRREWFNAESQGNTNGPNK